MPTFLARRFRQWSFVSFQLRGPPIAISMGRTWSIAAHIADLPADFAAIAMMASVIFTIMKSHHTWQHLGALSQRIALKGCGLAGVFDVREADAAHLRIANGVRVLTVAAAGTYAPTAAGERGHSRGRGMGRAARNEVARGTPAPRRPVRTAEVEPHAGAVVLPGGEW